MLYKMKCSVPCRDRAAAGILPDDARAQRSPGLRGDRGFNRRDLATRARGTGKDSGLPVEATFWQVFEFRDEKLIRTRMFGSRAADPPKCLEPSL